MEQQSYYTLVPGKVARSSTRHTKLYKELWYLIFKFVCRVNHNLRITIFFLKILRSRVFKSCEAQSDPQRQTHGPCPFILQ